MLHILLYYTFYSVFLRQWKSLMKMDGIYLVCGFPNMYSRIFKMVCSYSLRFLNLCNKMTLWLLV
jgi:hypothetical protein